MHYVTETVIASSKCVKLKHTKAAKCHKCFIYGHMTFDQSDALSVVWGDFIIRPLANQIQATFEQV